MKRTATIIALLFSCYDTVWAQDNCVALEVTSLTYDVNDPRNAVPIRTVESNHFTPEVEHHVRGLTAPLPEDIAFVLRYIPNHYRALTSMGTWQLQHAVPYDAQARVWSVDCYFRRAFSFRPLDGTLRFVYAVYLHKAKRHADAQKEYEIAEELGANSADLYYNRGLLEIELGNITQADYYAEKAYASGYPLPGLKNKIARAKKTATAKKLN